MKTTSTITRRATPWNKGKLPGQKAPLRLRDIWAIRVRLELAKRMRDMALFNLDSHLKRNSTGLRRSSDWIPRRSV